MRVVIISLLFLSGCYNMKESNRVDKSVKIEDAVDSAVATAPASSQEEDQMKIYEEKITVDKSAAKDKFNGSGGDGGVVMEDKSEARPPVPNPKPHNALHAPVLIAPAAQDTVVVEDDNGRGFITYYIPDTMKVGVEFKVNLRIGKKNSVSISAGLPSTSVKKEIRVGRTMQAIIEQTAPDSSDFKIDALNTAIQSIENDTSFTTWEWSIVPLRSGKHGLKLVVVIKENNLTKDIPVYEDNIYVYSSPFYSAKHFITENWKYFMSSMIIPVIGWWFNKRRKKKQDEPEEDKPENENG